MNNDPWLDKWLDLIKQKSTNGRVLELGCGNGRDTVDLLSAGCKVIATDILTENLIECTKSPFHANLVQMDHSQPFPFAEDRKSVV